MGRIERLQNVVAGGGQKARLRPVRKFRRLLRRVKAYVGFFQPAQSGAQFLGAAAHAVFEIYRRLEQGECIALLVHRALDPRN